jgi:hypothetical protein
MVLLLLAVFGLNPAHAGTCYLNGVTTKVNSSDDKKHPIRRKFDADTAKECQKELKKICRDIKDDWLDPDGLKARFVPTGASDATATYTLSSACGVNED